ncbi:hypothetical protein [Desulfobacula sp.]
MVQKTHLSCFDPFILVEYQTHMGPDIVLTLNPDHDRNGKFDTPERELFLDQVASMLMPNISATLDRQLLTLEEMTRNIAGNKG